MVTTPTLWDGPFQVNSLGPTIDTRSDITALTPGGPFDGYFVVWEEITSFSDRVIKGQRYSALGVKVGDEVKLGVEVPNTSQSEPAVTTLATGSSLTGRFAVAFEHSFTQYDIHVNIIDTDFFSPNMSHARLDTIENSSKRSFDPAIASFSNGGYVVSYTYEFALGDLDVRAQIVGPDGTIGPLKIVNDDTTFQSGSQVAVLSNDNFVVVYESEEAPNDFDIGYAVYTQGGTLVKEGFVPGGFATVNEMSPDVAALKNGGFVVVWADDAGDSSGSGIRFTIFNSTGTATSAQNIQANTTTAGNQHVPNVVTLNDGTFVISWNDNTDVHRAQRFDTSGNKIGTEIILGDAGYSTTAARAAVLDDGRLAFSLDIYDDVFQTIWDPRTSPIIGTNGLDNLTSRHEGASVFGRGGNDILWGLEGDDRLFGEGGNDNLFGFHGNDFLSGGNGNDGILGVSLGNDTIHGDAVNDSLFGEQGNDILRGGTGADTMDGGVGNDKLNGGAGNDTLLGNAGSDKLDGSAGNDTLNGGAGNDTLTGGLGKDILTGGAGKDKFDFNSIKESKKGGTRDQIKDFKRGQDKIDLKGIDANTKKGGDQKFKFIGSEKFNKKAGELRFDKKILQGDVDGDGKADFEIRVDVSKLSSSDFVL